MLRYLEASSMKIGAHRSPKPSCRRTDPCDAGYLERPWRLMSVPDRCAAEPQHVQLALSSFFVLLETAASILANFLRITFKPHLLNRRLLCTSASIQETGQCKPTSTRSNW